MPAPREGKILGREWAIHELMQTQGITLEQANAQLIKAWKKYRIGYNRYCSLKAYRFEDDNIKEQIKQIENERAIRREKRKQSRKERRTANQKNAIEKIMQATGWDEATTTARIKEAHTLCGASYEQYYLYRLYEHTPEEQTQFYTQRMKNKINRKYAARPFMATLLGDKERTNFFFGEYIQRPWCVNTQITEQEFIERFASESRLFYKPLRGHQGNGAQSIDVSQEDLAQVYTRLKNYPIGVIEGYIHQHPQMNNLSSTAVNTMRVVTISSNNEPVNDQGDFAVVAYAMLKIGGETGCVDNLAGGGMAAGVDPTTGKLCTDAVDEQDHIFETHPVTGTRIKGFEIPYFNEAIDLALGAIKKYKIAGHLGWDIAITQTGPELVELNTDPAAILLQVPYVPEGRGMAPVMRKFM